MHRVDSGDITFGLIMVAVLAFVITAVTLSPRYPRDEAAQSVPTAGLQQEPTTTSEGP